MNFVLFHNITCYIDSLLSRIYVNTTDLLNITCSLVATSVLLWNERGTNFEASPHPISTVALYPDVSSEYEVLLDARRKADICIVPLLETPGTYVREHLRPCSSFLGSVAGGLGSTDREVGEIFVLNLKLARQTAYRLICESS